MSDDQYKQIHAWLSDLDHVVRGNGSPGLKERQAVVEQTLVTHCNEIAGIKTSLEKKSDRQWYATLTLGAAVLADIVSHWLAQHIK